MSTDTVAGTPVFVPLGTAVEAFQVGSFAYAECGAQLAACTAPTNASLLSVPETKVVLPHTHENHSLFENLKPQLAAWTAPTNASLLLLPETQVVLLQTDEKHTLLENLKTSAMWAQLVWALQGHVCLVNMGSQRLFGKFAVETPEKDEVFLELEWGCHFYQTKQVDLMNV